MNGYLCYFMMPDIDPEYDHQEPIGMEMHTVADSPGEPGLERLGAFTSGFWLTSALELCTGSDEDKSYWIPPTAIYMVEIFHRPDPEDLDDTPEII